MLRRGQKAYLVLKRLIDLFGSFIGMLVLSPLLLLCLVIGTFQFKGHPIFRQIRIGKDEKPFYLWKFRSMKLNAPMKGAEDMSDEEKDSYVTRWGKFIRRTSLDEIPQLWQIFIGKMSFIGPRPMMRKEEEIDLYNARKSFEPNAFVVKPGLSGLAQIKMKRNHDIVEKSRLDSEYVKTFNLWLDIKLFVLSFLVLFGYDPGK